MVFRVLFLGVAGLVVASASLHCQHRHTIPISLLDRWEPYGGEQVITDSAYHALMYAGEEGSDAESARSAVDDEIAWLLAHTSIASAARITTMAIELYRQGDARRADTLFKSALNMTRSLLGRKKTSPDLAVAVTNMALFCYERRSYSYAKRLFAEAVAIRRKCSSGRPDPSLVRSILVLGAFYHNRTYDDSARVLLDEAVAASSGLEGADAIPLRIESLHAAGIVYCGQRDYGKADSLFAEAIRLARTLDADVGSPRFVWVLGDIASICQERGAYAMAMPLLAEVLAAQERWYRGEPHHDIASTLSRLGVLRQQGQDYAGADSAFTAALAMARLLCVGAADSLLAAHIGMLGDFHARHGDVVKAGALLEESLHIRRALYGDQAHPDLARNLAAVGRLRVERGDYVRADSVLYPALLMYRQLYGRMPRFEHATVYMLLGRALQGEGYYKDASAKFSEAYDMYRRQFGEGPHPIIAEILADRANLAIDRADYATSENYLNKALPMYRRVFADSSDPGFALCLKYAARHYHQRGELDMADSLFRESLAMFHRLDNPRYHRHLASCLTDLSAIRAERGDPAGALAVLKEAMALLRSMYGQDDRFDLAMTMNSIGGLYLAERAYDTAMPFLERAVAMYERLCQGKDHPDRAASIRNLAIAHAHNGDTTVADSLFTVALDICSRLYSRGGYLDHAMILYSVARAAEMFGMQKRAHDAYKELLRMLPRAMRESSLFEAEEQQIQFQARLSQASSALLSYFLRHGESGPLYDAALWSKGRVLGAVEWRNHVLMELGGADTTIMALRRDLQDAQRFLSDTRAGADSSYYDQWQVQRQKTLEMSRDIESKLTRQSATFKARKQESLWHELRKRLKRGECLVEFVRVPYATSKRWTDSVFYCALVLRPGFNHPDLVRLCEERQVEDVLRFSVGHPVRDSESYIHDANRRARLYELVWKPIDSLLARVGTVYISPDGILNRVAFGVLSGESGPMLLDRYKLLYLFSTRDVMPVPLLGNTPRVAEKTALVLGGANFDAADAPPLRAGGALRKRRHQVADRGTYWPGPGADGLQRESAVGTSPSEDGESFWEDDEVEADIEIPAPENPQVQREPVVGTLLQMAGGSPHEHDAVDGDPGLPNSEDDLAWRESAVGGSLRALAGSLQEADSLSVLLKRHHYGVKLLTGDQATEEAFLQLKSPSVLHVATHGFVFPEPQLSPQERERMEARGGIGMIRYARNPLLRSGLLLAGANRVWTGLAPLPEVGDGIVTAYDVATMNLSRTELVVLSACETGLGDIVAGEGVFGLKRAFRTAGARAVMISLWKVPDQQTQELMQIFYTNWLERKMDKAQALTEAQRELGRRYKDPYYWAAFVLMGE